MSQDQRIDEDQARGASDALTLRDEDGDQVAGAMSPYEAQRWDELQSHWATKAVGRKVLPERAQAALGRAGEVAKMGAATAGQRVSAATPQRVKGAAGSAFDTALAPTVHHVVQLLELLNDQIVDLTDPGKVFEFHQQKGRDVNSLDDLRTLDLEDLEDFTSGMALRWRTLGVGQGATFGAIAMIPVPVLGSVAAIGLDLVAMQALTAGIATRVCYSYGFDAADPEMKYVIERMVLRGYRDQLGKASTVKKAGAAFSASKDRVKWSQKLREDHRLMAAVEKLLTRVGDGSRVPVQKARMGMPFVSVIAGAATNSHVLGDTVVQARHYGATLRLAENYGLDIPSNLRNDLAVMPVDEMLVSADLAA